MGQLLAWHYRTTLFAKLADHTYVTCGNRGMAWSCWGGKQGGNILRLGNGSTKQANAIANPDEKAGIKCYLINGVCHQAANRILFPAGITVRGARGYSVSEALFGTYGRPRGFLGFCKSPFNKHQGVTGDLPACMADKTTLSTFEKKILNVAGDDQSDRYQSYLDRVNALYGQIASDLKSADINVEESIQFQLGLFRLMVEFKLGDIIEADHLLEIRAMIEKERIQLEERFENKEHAIESFVEYSNLLAEKFQSEVANILDSDRYEQLLELDRDDQIILGNPVIANSQYADDFES